jgi:hypothetical protein
VTGEDVPDETALVPQWRYLNPRAAEWPKADFIVGNPPFIGNKRMREALGDGYVEALRGAWPAVPESADFVMYWWQHCGALAHSGSLQQFGLITTNSIRQVFNRRVVTQHLADGKVSLVFAVPDHPWVDSANGAAVRIAMTVGSAQGSKAARLVEVTGEQEGADGEVAVSIRSREGSIGPALTLGVEAAAPGRLRSNAGISYMGVILCGDGFFVDDPEAKATRRLAESEGVVRQYLSGTDLAKRIRGRAVIDLTGHSADDARRIAPVAFQWVLDRVKPVRDQSNRRAHRDNWWLYGEKRPLMRSALSELPRYIATARTAKFRIFQFVRSEFLAESNVIVVASSDSLHLGILSSSLHIGWAERMGATLEDRPHYTNSTVFEPFPFPSDDTALTPALTDRIRSLAEQLDAHRKARQAAHPDLTLTGMYNVLEKLRRGEPLAAKDKLIHAQGLVSVLKSLHDELDAAVLAAYGWADLQAALADHAQAEARAAAVETLLERLVALNARRAAEEAAGTVRWLRPEFQCRSRSGEQTTIATDEPTDEAATAPAPAAQRPWPAGLPEQIKLVAEVLAGSARALALAEIEARFSARGRWRERLPVILQALEALGRVRRSAAGVPERWQAA